MNIVTPISSLSEMEMLLHNGADELYCGLRTPEWDALFNQDWWMNRRSPENANISSWNDLKTLTGTAHANGVSVSITLNASFYPEQGMAHVLSVCDRLAHDIQVDTFIVSDLNLLIELSTRKFPVRIHLSSLGSCFNSYSIDYYQSLGVKRIILPRQLKLSEIKSIAANCSTGMEFEVFALNDGCFYEEGFCQTSHSLGAFCLTDWAMETDGQGAGETTPARVMDFKSHQGHLKEYLWFQNNCGSSFQADGLPNGPCSLCWFGHFRDWGIAAVKIVGREASFHRKMGSLQLVKAVRDKTMTDTGHDRIKAYARDLRQTPDYCNRGYMCYFGPDRL